MSCFTNGELYITAISDCKDASRLSGDSRTDLRTLPLEDMAQIASGKIRPQYVVETCMAPRSLAWATARRCARNASGRS